MSCISQCNTLHTFSKTCVFICSFLPSFASALVVIPARSLRSTFIIFSSINRFHNLLYLIAIYNPFRIITTIYYSFFIISANPFCSNLKLIFSILQIYVKGMSVNTTFQDSTLALDVCIGFFTQFFPLLIDLHYLVFFSILSPMLSFSFVIGNELRNTST